MVIEALISKLTGKDTNTGVPTLPKLPEHLKDLIRNYDPNEQSPYDVMHAISRGLLESNLPRPSRQDARDILEIMERKATLTPVKLRVIKGGKQ